ncbi:tyrosine-type recombinase/integrase [Bifidobacterium bombi]|uniref:Phage integrase family protein n=1 Tax=Bifidobacterium bombi DSM 19703 TaxID=1341695 RepID=A0A080N6J9_9BIFI|nr:site-specific integrase [Bifidobacterium bombi]KFF31689.1 phage integrase family protein [Bifidobacterium bombi DSM 19703]
MTVKRRRTKGSGGISKPKSNGLYEYSMELPPDPATGKRRRLVVRAKDQRVAKARFETRKKEYERTGKTGGSHTPELRDWIDRWLNEIMRPQLKPRTLETYRSIADSCVNPAVGGVRLDKIGPQHFRLLEEYVTSDDPTTGRRARSSSMALHAYQLLSKALKDAVAEGLIDSNPADRTPRPRVTQQQVDILTPAQAARMIGMETDPMNQLMWRIAFLTGLRQGERLGITPSELIQVDDVTCLSINWQLQRIKDADFPAGVEHRDLGGDEYLIRPKTKSGHRLIPLTPELATALAAWVEECGAGPDDLIFTTNGRPISPMGDTRRWRQALERAGLPRVRVHSARHTMATMLTEAGVDEQTRILLMGHTKASTTAGYTHLNAHDLLGAVTSADRMIRA